MDSEINSRQILNREIVKLENVPVNFVVDTLELSGHKFSKLITNLSYDLGTIGDEMQQGEIMELLGIPEKKAVVDGEEIVSWDIVSANLKSSVLSESQSKSLDFEPKIGYRLCVLENVTESKRIFYEIPELDVAQFFSKIVNESEVDEIVKRVDEKKGSVVGQFLTSGDEYLSFCTDIYSLWNQTFKTGNFEKVDNVMNDLYPKLAPGENYKTVDTMVEYARTAIKQEENDIPAENWWKIRSLINKTIKLIVETKDFDVSFKKVIEVINLVSDNSSLYSDQLWVLVVKPLMSLYCEGRGGENYDKQGFVKQIIENVEAEKSGHVLMQNNEVRELFGLQKI
jgi:hypothetical protein